MEEQKRAACKRKMKAFYRRQAKASRLDGARSSRTKLSPGMIGFLCTCGSGGERWCVREAYNLLNQFAELMHGPENAAVNETTKDSSNETTKDITNETTANTTTDTTSETTKDSTNETTKDITNQTTKDSTTDTTKDTTDNTTNNTNDTKDTTKGCSNDISTDITNDDTGKSDVSISREGGQDKGGQVATVDGCDMEAAFEAELAQLRRQTVASGNGDGSGDGSGDGGVRPRRRFQQVLCPVSNCVFISTTLEEPGPLVERIMNHVQETGVQCCRHLIRMLPVDVVCKADEKSLSAALDGLLPGCFPADSAVTYSVVYKRRHQCKLGEETVRQLVAECVGRLRAGLTSVDYRCPELCVLVDGIANIALLTVVRRYFQYKKYNLIELARSSCCHDNASDGGGGGGRVAMATSTSDNQTATTENTAVSMETKEDNVDAGVHNENTTVTDAVSMATPVDNQCCHSNQSE